MRPSMIEHWCGKSVRGSLVALSAAAVVACSPHSYDLGKDGSDGEAGAGLDEGSGGSSTSGKGGSGGKAGKGGTGGTTGGTTGTGGSSIVGAGGEGDVGQSTGGSSIGARGGTGGTGGSTTLPPPPPHGLHAASKKLDLLFMVDNSIGMAEKQATLAKSVTTLMERLTTPRCVDASGAPTGQRAPNCPAGTAPEMEPVTDIHAGVITSSLGDHGSGDVCSDAQNAANVASGGPPSDYNDLAQLLPSVRSDVGSEEVLVWDEATVNSTAANAALTEKLAQQIRAAGERGCGYEAQLESWYRFLVDPEPVVGMTTDVSTSISVRGAVNETVLAQRAAFLRPDSVVAIVMLTDENDCSIVDEDGTQGWLVGYKGGVNAGQLWHMPQATAVCTEDPNNECCRPCISNPEPGCPDNAHDALCSQGTTLPIAKDSMNLRCFHQMQRFGIDLLYPTARYTEALTSPTLHPRFGGSAVPNPLFYAADGGVPRDPSQIVLTGIVGVPWQDIATEGDGGLTLTYLTNAELTAGNRWNMIVGDPAANVDPLDPLMIESIDPRPTGSPHPLLADAAIAGPEETENVNPINGHEQAALSFRDDLQFACIYPLSLAVACNDANADTCNCNYDEFDKNSPLCTGVTEDTDGTQVNGKAYPGLRELQVLQGQQGVVASACPRSTDDEDIDWGYTPAMKALADRLRGPLGYSCGPAAFRGGVCAVIEARRTGSCDCDAGAGRLTPSAYGETVATTAAGELQSMGLNPDDYCLCQIAPLAGNELDACLNSADGGSGAGYCFIDPDNGAGDQSLVASCPGDNKYRVRFVGGIPADGAMLFSDCEDPR